MSGTEQFILGWMTVALGWIVLMLYVSGSIEVRKMRERRKQDQQQLIREHLALEARGAREQAKALEHLTKGMFPPAGED